MAAKAVCFTEALRPEFKRYARGVVENARALAEACAAAGAPVHTGTTENHLVLLDMRPLGLTGYQAEAALRQCGVTLNRNALPFDPQPPLITSGLRLGSAAVTTLGMGAPEMQEIAGVIGHVLKNLSPGATKRQFVLPEKALEESVSRVRALLARFPLYPEIDLPSLERRFLADSPAPPQRGGTA
jgi:glycine hydroxymethyltransferase